MKVVRGDLLRLAWGGSFDVIVHGCNCGNTMGAGIALSIKERFPEAYRADTATPKWDRSKLGTISYATVPVVVRRGANPHAPTQTQTPTQTPTQTQRHSEAHAHAIIVVNGYTQYHWRGRKGEALVDYNALRSVMRLVRARFGGKGKRIGYPRIGAGLAGGDWTVVARIIDEELEGEDHTLVEYEHKHEHKHENEHSR